MKVKELLKVLLVLLVYILLPIAVLSAYSFSCLEKIIRRFKKDSSFDIFTVFAVFPKNEEMNWIGGIPKAMRTVKIVGVTEGLGNHANNASFLTRISMN